MKKTLFIIIFLFLYSMTVLILGSLSLRSFPAPKGLPSKAYTPNPNSYVYALPANLSPMLIPKDTEDIFLVKHYSYQTFNKTQIIWECKGKKFNTLEEVLSFLKNHYRIIIIFKDPIDNDYFVCVKNKK